MKRLRVLALMHDDLVPPDSIDGRSDEEISDWRTEFDVVSTLLDLGHDVHKLGIGDDVAPIREAVEAFQPHVVFNMLVEFHGQGAYDQHIASHLELLRTNYTGCNPRGLTLARDKALSKEILTFHGVPVPRFQTFLHGRRVRRDANLRFPLFVKSVIEEASLGISERSIVRTDAALAKRVRWFFDNVGTDVIAEEYIEGRELYVGVMGNDRLTVMPPRELRIAKLAKGAPTIATRRVKWDIAYQREMGVQTFFPELPSALEREVKQLAKRAYKSLRMSGYGRMDFRLDADGRLFLLEANPNADLTYGEDFAEAAEAAGIPYEELIQRLLNLAQRYPAGWKAAPPSAAVLD